MDVISDAGARHARQTRKISHLDRVLKNRFEDRLRTQSELSRQLVSFQANKERPGYRWYKYKEAFSASLVEFLLAKHDIVPGTILDPFAGMGTTLFATAAMGWDAEGIELLPIGQEIIQTRRTLECLSRPNRRTLTHWCAERPWRSSPIKMEIGVLRITRGAYPAQTLNSMERYSGALEGENRDVRRVLRFALLCILESISFTRKDGQYLRWDQRSGRSQGAKPFDKGHILSFDEAISHKLRQLLTDCGGQQAPDLFAQNIPQGEIKLRPGSCLRALPALADSAFAAIITSPPYCNRYDYTRTYALELAALGVDEKGLSNLRQEMLSCTVENRAKDLLVMNINWKKAVAATDDQELLHAILKYLEDLKDANEINNPNIPRMVRHYFYEMACVIHEGSRVLKNDGLFFMVNDNVRYGGVSIPVDLILCDIAERLGLSVERILVLPSGKGNSSQQMGVHGRDQLRKCVYVWRKK